MNYHVEIVFCFVLFVCFLKQDLCRPGFTFNSNPSGLSFANAGVTGMDYHSWARNIQKCDMAQQSHGENRIHRRVAFSQRLIKAHT